MKIMFTKLVLAGIITFSGSSVYCASPGGNGVGGNGYKIDKRVHDLELRCCDILIELPTAKEIRQR